MSRHFLNFMNRLLTLIIAMSLFVLGTYAIYAIWDDNRIYSEAEDVQKDLLDLKPDVDDPSFEELMAINSDVCAWLTLDNTNIDYPILQGEDILTYISTDVYGEYSLSGSIFLDNRNSNDFSDAYNLVYGHHMAESKMFGDLDLYEDEEFFNENTTGTLITPERTYQLTIFSCLVVSASEDNIFEVTTWQSDSSGIFAYAKESAKYYREVESTGQVIALSTCSSDYTDARTIVMAVMK